MRYHDAQRWPHKEVPMSRRPLVNRRAFLAAAPVAAAALPPDKTIDKPKRLPTSYPGAQLYDDKERMEVNAALESRSLFRWYGPGNPAKVAAFEQEMARYMGAKYVLAVTSGTAALHVALTALGVGPGDEVILPAWAWYACYNTILMTGALPVFAETDESLNIDPEDVEKKITPRTKAVMVLHLSGCPADMDPIMAVARKHRVRVLEDAAQSVGASYKGRRVAAIGDIGIFSFQLSKTITAGEGGAVLTNDPMLFERATRFHDLGMLRPGHKDVLGAAAMQSFVGVNYRMNEMTGGVMRAQLRKLDGILERLRRNSRTVRERIHDVPGLKQRRIPDPEGEIGLAIHLLLPDKTKRDRFVAAMRAEKAAASPPGGSLHLPGVPYIEQKVAVHPAWPTFHTPHGKAIRYGAGCCPRTVKIFDRVAVVPIGVRDTAADLDHLVHAIRKAYGAISG
jgi:8-amino-3,8-dideoxy-alpha-D-manno-octulosonate transaminase